MVEELRCFWADGQSCAKSDWPACGYNWLMGFPVGIVWLVWLLYGGHRLRSASATSGWFQFDVSKIHDPIAQGMAIALSQRRSSSSHRPRFQRYMKLCAMWAEWPSFSYTPLTIAFKVAGSNGVVNPLIYSLNLPKEILNAALVITCGCAIVLARLFVSSRQRK
ncbi:hypothetical protein ACHHYP_01161 [Achlya hypogyna]|uniref:Uncharacterized protein n=1 Tax=Achlya hypogyna TaxID=1202772 RepID=A0A1V9ZTL5_ACHHY|nr:hypothetical protein ACHHYP_01161 [Achlya hypogyna]